MRFILMAAVSCFSLGAALSVPDKEPGFKPLVHGHDLAGWKVVGKGDWKVEEGEIVCPGKGGSWLRTEKEYDNFELRLEYRIPAKANSGVFIRVPEEGRSSRIGFEIQILDDYGKPPNKNSTGSLYDIIPPSKSMIKPVGEWNQESITCDGSHITVELNGEKVIDVKTDDPELNAKFDDIHKPMLRHKKGYLGLQDHGAGVRFRSLRIKELKGHKP